MSTIGDMVRRLVEDREPRPEPSDLANAESPCECGVCGCNSPLIDPNRRPDA